MSDWTTDELTELVSVDSFQKLKGSLVALDISNGPLDKLCSSKQTELIRAHSENVSQSFAQLLISTNCKW